MLLVPGTCQPTPCQRAPRDDPDTHVLAQGKHLPLFLAVEEVVVVLHRREPGPAVEGRGVQRLGELPGVHRRGADVQGLARLDHVVQGLEGLLDRHLVVPAVDLVEVDVVGAETSQRVVDLGHDRLAGQSGAVGSRPHPHVHLGGDDDLVAVREVPQRASDDLLAGPVGVHVGGVEEVDTELEGLLDEGSAVLLGEGPGMGTSFGCAVAHAAQCHPRHVEAGRPELDADPSASSWWLRAVACGRSHSLKRVSGLGLRPTGR